MPASSSLIHGAAGLDEGEPARQKILILHEDFAAYSRAVEVCRRLMERFASMDFDIKCWNFIELADFNCARHAAKSARVADLILLSMQTLQPPVELERWLDFSFTVRFKPDGMLALVWNVSATPPATLEKLVLRLGQLAGGLGMNFISLLPDADLREINVPPVVAALRTHGV
jgi:hypothetical protein